MRSMRRRPPGKGRAGTHRTTCERRGRCIKLSSEIGVVLNGRRERPFRGERPWSPVALLGWTCRVYDQPRPGVVPRRLRQCDPDFG
jgi:hypothetical protein